MTENNSKYDLNDSEPEASLLKNEATELKKIFSAIITKSV